MSNPRSTRASTGGNAGGSTGGTPKQAHIVEQTFEPAQALVSVAPIISPERSDAIVGVRTVEQEMNARWLERQRPLRGALISLIAHHHMVMIGSPGEAKSALIDDLRSRIVGARGFKLLMSRFTTPEEVFGPISISALQQDRYARAIDGYLPTAYIGMLDETFKPGSSILNTLLTSMNEREFTNDGQVLRIPLISLFGASNEMPQGDELGALWDRFTARYVIEPLRGAALRRFLEQTRDAKLIVESDHTRRAAGGETTELARTKATITLEQLRLLHEMAQEAQRNLPDRVFNLYEDILRELQKHGFKVPSTRRTGWAMSMVAANAVLNGRLTPNEMDLSILSDVLWEHVKEAREVGVLVLKVAHPRLAQAQDIMDSVNQVRQGCFDFWAESGSGRAQKNSKVIEARSKITEEGSRLRHIINDAKQEGEDTAELDQLLSAIKQAWTDVTNLAAGEEEQTFASVE